MNEALTGLVGALCLALLHFLWQGVVIGGVARLALCRLKDAGPQARYAVACTALLVCLLTAAATLAVALLPARGPDPVATAGRVGPGSPPARATYGVPATAGSELAPWLVAFWAAGSGVMFLRLGIGLASIERLRRRPPAPREWQARLDRLAARLGLGDVALVLADGLGSPLSAGWWRPIVLLPAGLLTRMPVDYIEALLAHELAHIRRHDYLINLLQLTIEALLFYHPAVWWLSRQIRLEREQIADQLAVATTGTQRPLALALAELAEVQALEAPPLALAGSGGVLKARIELLLRPRQTVRRPAAVVLPLLGVATAALGLAACTVAARSDPEPAAPFAAADGPPRLSYALVRGDAEPILAWGPDDEIDQVARALPRRAEDYVLVRRNGRDGLVVDAAVVEPLRRAWEEAEALETEARALERTLQDQDRRAQQLALQLATAPGAAAALDRAARDRSALEPLIAELGRKEEAAYRQVERQLREVVATAPSTPL